ncbi:MAG: phospholipase D-like domain-containing protein [Bacteroidota bacterium]|nr:phospholipase D-like domain-containing protein [Bacteroidota bacterium]
MRKSKKTNGLKVTAIAGSYAVILGFDMAQEDCKGLLGFSIHRTDHSENECYYMKGMKTFEETDPGFPSGSLYSTKDHPWQGFQWSDYSAKPGNVYTYTITALKEKPSQLIPFATTKLKITTESEENEVHNVYFNRGISAVQEYVRRFGDEKPSEDDAPDSPKFKWLSRGLYEALEDFIKSCEAGKHSLRISAYEFNYRPFLRLLKSSIDNGVDIKIIYDSRKDSPKIKNEERIIECGLVDHCIPRKEGKSYISHNKFIVKLENDIPISVWTGGTNFSVGGIFGHSNVAHVIEEKETAMKFLEYWNELSQDKKTAVIKNDVERISPTPILPILIGKQCVFSPRKNLDALNLYRDLALSAKTGLFMTFAFGINDLFKNVYKTSNANLRFALLEKKTRSMKQDSPEKKAEEDAIDQLRFKAENIFAIGDFIKTNKLDGWVKETLSDLNRNVQYVHNKFMLIDPLSRNPIVITGSANFSNASTLNNDENMVIICGNKRVADIYLGEYMRLFSHHSFRESLKWRKPDQKPKFLNTGDWWKDYYKNNDRAARRIYFSKIH